MFKPFKSFLLMLTAATVLSPQSNAADTQAVHVADTMLEKLHTVSGVPGLSVAVAKNGKILWQGTAGWRDVQNGLPVTPETTFRFASVSKVFAATLAAKLVEERGRDFIGRTSFSTC